MEKNTSKITPENTENTTYALNMKNAENAKAAYDNFIEESKHPYEVNLNLLMQILQDNKDTEYGKKYDFASIKTYEDYAAKVPIIEYDDIDEYVERMAKGEKNILTAYPFTHMNLTSGTIGKQKKIPMTNKLQQNFLDYDKNYKDAIYTKFFGEDWMRGRIFCTSQGASHELPSGITVGDASSVMAKYVTGGMEGLNKMMQTMFTSPVEASIPEPGSDVVYLHCRFALADKHITGMVSGYFVMIVQYMHYIATNYEMLIEDIKTGTINANVSMSDEVRSRVESRIQPDEKRAAELAEIFKHGSNFCFVPEIWPDLKFFSGVGGAGFTVYSKTLRNKYAGDKIDHLYSGITASEGLFSIPVEINDEDGALAPHSLFFEFLPVEAEDDFSQIVTLDKLEVGRVYEIILTNVSGFYRYRMRDCIKVISFFNKTPRVRYMYRSNKVLNLACEKTTEDALAIAVEKTARELDFELSDYCVYGDKRAVPPQYVFLIQPETERHDISKEELAKSLEKNIKAANQEYSVCINCLALQPSRAEWLQPQTSFLYKDIQVANGASASQFKPVRFIADKKQKKFFYGFIDTGKKQFDFS